MVLTKTQQAQVSQLKQFYPYRIIYIVIDKDTNEFTASAVNSMRIPNKLARDGHTVYTV